MAESYYEILGVSSRCTLTELTKAFRKLALVYHPDKNPGGNEKFKEISKAYRVLMDPDTRASYDHGQFDPDQFGQNFEDFSDFNFDIPSKKSSDLVCRLKVELEALYNGQTMETNLKTIVTCSLCVIFNAPKSTCKICSGTGERSVTKKIKIDIKKGTFNGQKIRLIGKGNEYPNHLPGDIVIVVTTLPHRRFQLEGTDLVAKLNLPISTAMNGGVLQLETLDHRWLRFKIKSLMTADGLDLSGTRVVYDEGMPDYFEPLTKGNLLIEFGLDLPPTFERKTNSKLKNKLINYLPLELDFDEAKTRTLDVFDTIEDSKNFKECGNFKETPYVFYGPARDTSTIRHVKAFFFYLNVLLSFILMTVKRCIVAIYKTIKIFWKLVGLASRPVFWIADFILSWYWFHYHVWVPNIFGIQKLLSWFCIFCYMRRTLKVVRFVLKI